MPPSFGGGRRGPYPRGVDRDRILETIRARGGLADVETAIRAARAVVCSLRDRLTDEESADLVAALRAELPELLACDRHPHRAPERARDRLTEPEVADRVREEAGLADRTEARRLIRVVLAALSTCLGAGDDEQAAERRNVVRGLGALARARARREEGDEE